MTRTAPAAPGSAAVGTDDMAASRARDGAGRLADGFTLIEVLVAAALLFVVLAAVGSTAGIATRAMQTNDRRAEIGEKVQRFLQRITQLTRGGVLLTYRVEATEDDVTGGRASAAGEWIEPLNGERRAAIRFRSADGILAMKANSLTSPTTLRFRMDAAEAAGAAGRDDDGDGLIDEGVVEFDHNGVAVGVLTGVDSCSFTLEGFLLTVEGRSARTTSSPFQFAFKQVFAFRNN